MLLMGPDTVKLRGPEMGATQVEEITNSMSRWFAVDYSTGEIFYDRLRAKVETTRGHRVSVELMSQKFQASGKGEGSWVECDPYLLVEGSVHKALLGHNVYGGPADHYSASSYLLDLIVDRFGCELPHRDEFVYRRIDPAQPFQLPGPEACAEYIDTLNHAEMPRREASSSRHGRHGFSARGDTTALDLYHKWPEFRKHDRQRLRRFADELTVAEIQAESTRTLRAEVSISARKLDADFGRPPTLVDMTDDYLHNIYDAEMFRLLREGKGGMETVRTRRAVRERLFEKYGAKSNQLPMTLYSTWRDLAEFGEAYVKAHMSRPTFYRHRKQLTDAEVSWHGSDFLVVERASLVPRDFSPVRTDPRRVVAEDPRVAELLAPYRSAA